MRFRLEAPGSGVVGKANTLESLAQLPRQGHHCFAYENQRFMLDDEIWTLQRDYTNAPSCPTCQHPNTQQCLWYASSTKVFQVEGGAGGDLFKINFHTVQGFNPNDGDIIALTTVKINMVYHQMFCFRSKQEALQFLALPPFWADLSGEHPKVITR